MRAKRSRGMYWTKLPSLVLDLLVDGDQDVELRFGQRKQFAVLLAGPTHFRSRADLMASKLPPQSLRHTLVKQQSHAG